MKKGRILVVEDQVLFLETVVKMLHSSGYQVVSATDGEQAMQKLSTQITPFDVMLCDYAMPNMDGLSFVKAVRESPSWKDVPIVMLTAMADKKLVIQLAQLGVKHYLLKSAFSLAELRRVIDEAIRSA